jgi:hypothetical protein
VSALPKKNRAGGRRRGATEARQVGGPGTNGDPSQKPALEDISVDAFGPHASMMRKMMIESREGNTAPVAAIVRINPR